MASQFVISLDFELHWGVRDLVSLEQNRARLLNERIAVREIAKLFRARHIHATWATVGLVYAGTRDEARKFAPTQRPTYAQRSLDPYAELENAGLTEEDDPFHFGHSLVRLVADTPHQELGCHTYSHFYCLEEGQTLEQFRSDLESARAIGKPFGDVLGSIVFPRNQFTREHLVAAREAGVRVFRANPAAWFWQPRAFTTETLLQRALRLADAHAPVGGTEVQRVTRDESGLVNVPATRFLRPYSPLSASLDGLRLRRIKDEMTRAANQGGLFHLWWHPSNFASYLNENVSFLQRVFDHFEVLQRRYGMTSMTMAEAAAQV